MGSTRPRSTTWSTSRSSPALGSCAGPRCARHDPHAPVRRSRPGRRGAAPPRRHRPRRGGAPLAQPGSRCPTSGSGPRATLAAGSGLRALRPADHRVLARTADGGEAQATSRSPAPVSTWRFRARASAGGARRDPLYTQSHPKERHAHVPDPRRLRRGGPRGKQADRRSRDVGRRVRRAAPGGPVNKPMRISNWTQFARIYGDPANPENGPFMEGAYLAHCGVRLLPERRRPLLDRARRREETAARARAALPAATRPQRRGAARRGPRRESTARSRSRSPRRRRRRREDPTYKVDRHRGPAARGVPGVTLKKGRNYIATKVNAASKLIKLEETGAALPDVGWRRVSYTLAGAVGAARRGQAGRLRGRRRQAPGHGRPGRARRDHDARDARHDAVRQRRRRRPGARPPGQDDRPLRERGRPHGDPRPPAGPAARRTCSSGG